jgi:hypothetical protein
MSSAVTIVLVAINALIIAIFTASFGVVFRPNWRRGAAIGFILGLILGPLMTQGVILKYYFSEPVTQISENR